MVMSSELMLQIQIHSLDFILITISINGIISFSGSVCSQAKNH